MLRFVVAVVFAVVWSSALAAQEKGRKVAFLVGVGKYDFAFSDLGKAPEKDVTELATVLKAGGFEINLLTSSGAGKDRATRANVDARFKAILDGGDAKPAIKKIDTLLVHLCGHGLQIDGQSYFCPADAKPDSPATMVPLNGLIRATEANGATVLFLIDACREVKDENRSRTGIQGKKVELPAKTAVLFSCGQGQLAHQNDTLGHGLFTHAVLRTLTGETGLKGSVSWSQLVAGVETQFQTPEFRGLIPAGKPQSPVLAAGELDYTVLVPVRDPLASLSTDPSINPAAKPLPSDTPRHAAILAEAKKGRGDVILLGDSAMHGWESGAGKKAWADTFPQTSVVNMGSGGDFTGHVLWRITDGKVLDPLTPRLAVLLIGTNNVSRGQTPEQVAGGIKAIVDELRRQKPGMKILLLGLLPRGLSGPVPPIPDVTPADRLNPKIGQVNALISKLADDKMVFYKDVGKKLLDGDGGLEKKFMFDLLHLSGEGYAILSKAIKDDVAKLVK